MSDGPLLVVALAGALIGALAGLVPGLHVLSIAGAALLLRSNGVLPLEDEAFALAMVAMGAGWAVTVAVPGVFLSAPDESSAHSVLPATRMLLRGRGVQAAAWIGSGSAVAALALVALAPVLSAVMRPIHAIIQPHAGWMLLSIVVFLVLGEWPRGDDRAQGRLRRLAAAWAWLAAGMATFVLSGLLGIALMTRSPVAVERAFQSLAPVFAGLFVLPGLLQLALAPGRPPPQSRAVADIDAMSLVRGGLTGVAGGLFAGILPVVSGGIGALLAGHATAQRDERIFLVSQGASRSAYFCGSLLLLFAPGLEVSRGGLAAMLSAVGSPHGLRMYALALCVVAGATALGFGILLAASHGLARMLPRLSPRRAAIAGMLICVLSTFGLVGMPGLAILAAALPVGCIPVFVGGRRLNGLGVLLAPATLAMTGALEPVARALGLTG